MNRMGYQEIDGSVRGCIVIAGLTALLGTLALTACGSQSLYAAVSPAQVSQSTAAVAQLPGVTLRPSMQIPSGQGRMTTQRPAAAEPGLLPLSAEPASVGASQWFGVGCLMAGAMSLIYYLTHHKQQAGDNTWNQVEQIAIATWASEKEEGAPGPVKTIPGIKPRPAGYRHDVTRGYQLQEVSRPRRNRRHPAIRSFMRETHLSPANFIMPLFIHDEDYDTPINAMPGCNRLCAASVLREIGECVEQGVNIFILFPKISDDLKTPDGRQCYDPNDIVMRTLKLIKGAYPDVIVCTDVALDPYNTDGHDGIVDETTGVIVNDITVEQLCKQSLAQARAGADIVAPSDMQDGRIGAIRDALDGEGFTHVGIMSYCAKYASAFYGPFREALDSNPSFGDKSTYQMDPANRREALREIELDEAEGADILMVKPAISYLDVILTLKENSSLPIAAYQVSGEYSMIKAAAQQGFIDEQKVALESLLSIRRAGADVILTYFAKDAAKWINDPNGWWQKKMSGQL